MDRIYNSIQYVLSIVPLSPALALSVYLPSPLSVMCSAHTCRNSNSALLLLASSSYFWPFGPPLSGHQDSLNHSQPILSYPIPPNPPLAAPASTHLLQHKHLLVPQLNAQILILPFSLPERPAPSSPTSETLPSRLNCLSRLFCGYVLCAVSCCTSPHLRYLFLSSVRSIPPLVSCTKIYAQSTLRAIPL